MQLFTDPSAHNDTSLSIISRTARYAAWFSVALGLFMIIAWYCHIEWLVTNFYWIFYMQVNTALLFFVSGLGLLFTLGNKKRRVLVTGSASFLVIVGLITIIEFLTGINIGIDELLLKDYLHTENAYPGRISPNTALAFICVGVVLILSTNDNPRLSYVIASELLSFFVFVLGTMAMAGHLSVVEIAYNWGTYSRMSIPTAAGLVVLGVGLLALVWHNQNVRIARIPLWVPALLCFLIFLFDLAMPLSAKVLR